MPYPSISKSVQPLPIYAFDKLDGSNIRVEWTRKGGFASVANGSLAGMTFEGVVCKSQQLTRNRQTLFKVKNRAWLDRLKARCGDDEATFERLA